MKTTTTTSHCGQLPPSAFIPRRQNHHHPSEQQRAITSSSLSLSSSSSMDDYNTNSKNIYDDWTEERKNQLFQSLLRDLQIEQVPLLSIDGTQTVDTMNAAIWTTICELYDADQNQNKVCMILEEIPISALRSLVDEFLIIKSTKTTGTTVSLIDLVPELNRISLSLVGKGIGPGLIIEIDKGSNNGDQGSHHVDEGKAFTVMSSFMNRMIGGQTNICPYYQSFSKTIRYRRCTRSNNMFHILSSFWNGICEMSYSNDISSVVLCFDEVVSSSSSFPRFIGITDVLSRIFRLYRGDQVYDILYFHPQYNRNDISPIDQPTYGHLPPYNWFQGMIENYNDDGTLLSYYNYQRRSPLTSICIKRLNVIDQVTMGSGMMDVSIPIVTDDNNTPQFFSMQIPSSIVFTQRQNIQTLQSIGLDTLQYQLDNEIQQLY